LAAFFGAGDRLKCAAAVGEGEEAEEKEAVWKEGEVEGFLCAGAFDGLAAVIAAAQWAGVAAAGAA
jgi:hypothetical protein